MKTRLLIIIGIVAVVAVGVIGIVILNHYISVEREFELNNTPDNLKGIFGNCKCQEDPERTCTQTFIDWENSTHYIDNNLCKFITLEKHLTMIDEKENEN